MGSLISIVCGEREGGRREKHIVLTCGSHIVGPHHRTISMSLMQFNMNYEDLRGVWLASTIYHATSVARHENLGACLAGDSTEAATAF